MKTAFELGPDAAAFAGEGTLKLPAQTQPDSWPLIGRAFAALEQLHAAGGFGSPDAVARLKWLDDEARVDGESARRRWRVDVQDVPGVFWRVLVGMLGARGVQELTLRTDAVLESQAQRNPPRRWLDARLIPPPDLAFDIHPDEDPKERPDRLVRLEFRAELDSRTADRAMELLLQWHEALWGGFDDLSEPLRLFPGASAYQLDPCTVVSRIDHWSSSDEAWALLLHLGRHIDRRIAALSSVLIE